MSGYGVIVNQSKQPSVSGVPHIPLNKELNHKTVTGNRQLQFHFGLWTNLKKSKAVKLNPANRYKFVHSSLQSLRVDNYPVTTASHHSFINKAQHTSVELAY